MLIEQVWFKYSVFALAGTDRRCSSTESLSAAMDFVADAYLMDELSRCVVSSKSPSASRNRYSLIVPPFPSQPPRARRGYPRQGQLHRWQEEVIEGKMDD